MKQLPAFPSIYAIVALLLSGCILEKEREPAPAFDPSNQPIVLMMTPSGDTTLTPVKPEDTTALPVVLSKDYFMLDSTFRVSTGRDTLTFTYKSFSDSIYSNTIADAKFWLIKGSEGNYLIQAEIAADYSDAIELGPKWNHSLNASAVFAGGLPKGDYKVEIRARDYCFCMVLPRPAVFKESFRIP